ncbi:DivIVA domain-containing protein [Kribbella sp. NPDC050459]|uniref:DivIVA domain-containing protein n=1 Tax=Kribbella sp. NPDC050459 TaxID=3155785 RepID=UPI0033F705C3
MWFFGLIVVLLIGAVAVVASGRWGAMNTAYDDRPDMTVPARQALTSTDIESARFAVGVRGYRMDEVDTLLERVAKEVAERDRRIADLERAVAPIVEAPDGHGFTSRPYDPAEFEDTGTQPPILVGGDFPADDPADAPGSTSGTAGADGPGGTAHEAGSADDADEASGPAGAAGSGGSAHTPGGADEASGTPSSAAGAADGADGPGGTAQAAGGAAGPGGAAHAAGGEDEAGGTAGAGGSEDGPAGSAYAAAGDDGPSGTGGTPYAAGTAGPGGSAYAEAGDADEPETSELPRASRAAADEYERLQAEARAVLEAQSQPVSPRRTPAPQQPAGESASLTPAQRYDQLVQNQRPAPSQSAPAEPEPDSQTATHWTSQPRQQEQARDTQATEQAPDQQSPQQQEQGGETQATEQAKQQTPQQQGGVEAANGAAGDEEGWRFWPPADQAGEGAYHRPS